MATSLPVGKPAIPRPPDASSGVGQAIDNIRARFVALEAALAALTASTSNAEATLAAAIASLRRQIAQILQAIALLEQQGGGSGGSVVTRTFSAGESMDSGVAVWISGDGVVSMIDPDDPLACSGFVGITASSAAEGDDVEVRIPGGVVELDGASFTAGEPVYAAYGALTQTPSGNPLPVGVAIDSTLLAVTAGTTALTAFGFDPAREDYMPASVALVREAVQGGGILPVVTGDVPPVFVYLDDGSLVYTEVE